MSRKPTSTISKFFRPQPKAIGDEGSDCRRTCGSSNDVIVLDDSSDDDLDDKNIGIVDLTEGLESEGFRNEISQRVETADNDEQDDRKGSDGHEKKTEIMLPSKCDEDVVRDELTKRNEFDHHDDTDLKSCDTQQISNTRQDPILSAQKSPIVVKEKENPFARFAFGASTASESAHDKATARITWTRHSLSSTSKKRANNDSHNASRSKKIHSSSKEEKKKEKEFVKMKDISPEEQLKITRKWHSMADPLASLEVRRYQVLLAARLHARCQEPTVRRAILKLREHFASFSAAKTITVEEMAKSDPEELARHISCLQFYNVKAKQIVKAAQEIQSRHGGIVPEDEFSLLQITGIGKTFADLLAFVNKRESHERLASPAETTLSD